ncbi:MAG: phage major capsid protein [Roseovarius sp.]|nr:phage major capsid protein [Roseovarius sp.]
MDLTELKDLVQQGNAAFDEKTGQLSERLDQIETKVNRPGATASGNKSSLIEEAKSLREFCETGEGLERKAGINTGTGSEGGFALPKQISDVIQDQLINVSPIRQIARIVQVQSSDYTHLVGTRGAGATWRSELGTGNATDAPGMAAVQPTHGELFAFPEISTWALDDLTFDPEAWLQMNVTDQFAVAEGAAFVSGDGSDKPTGFLSGPTPVTTGDASRAFGTLQYIATGAASDLGSTPEDTLVDLTYTLSAPYRAGAAFVMNSQTAARYRKLKDADGRFLWADSMQAGQPPMLLGYPVVLAEDMPDIAADAFPVAFGDFRRGYLIADRTDARIIRDEVTKPGAVRYIVQRRIGGKLADTNAIKLLKVAAS